VAKSLKRVCFNVSRGFETFRATMKVFLIAMFTSLFRSLVRSSVVTVLSEEIV
jgi:hypothetical protein